MNIIALFAATGCFIVIDALKEERDQKVTAALWVTFLYCTFAMIIEYAD